MTTIRERIEYGERGKEVIDFFWKNKGATPLCCFETNANGKVKCGYTKRFLPRDEFHFICLGCQETIKELLEKKK